MRSKAIWLVLSCLIIVVMVMTSCGPATTEEEEGKTIVGKVVEKEAPPEKEEPKGTEDIGKLVVREVGEPKYGGSVGFAHSMPIAGFDDYYTYASQAITVVLTNEQLVTGDWAKGPAGTNEASWLYYGTGTYEFSIGAMAESWELPDDETIIFNIRKGVRFHNKAPVNGREMDANDVVYSLKRLWYGEGMGGSPGAIANTRPADQRPVSITAPDKWTVIIKTPPGAHEAVFGITAEYMYIIPHEVVEEYGDLRDWRVSVGTGPYMIVDHVDSSSSTLVRNPDYWMKDPVHPENTLPYIDEVKYFIIPDRSTQNAAVRTAKVDWIFARTKEEADSLLSTNPDLQYNKFVRDIASHIFMRVDNPDLPYYDKRVRHALAMAIDNPGILEYMYGGDGALLVHPVLPTAEFSSMYVPIDELPESTRELYEHHPEKAKQLLADAGYPDGFKIKVVTSEGYVDILSLVQAQWAEIGVDMEIRVLEHNTLQSLLFTKRHEEMATFWSTNAPPQLGASRSNYVLNVSAVSDQRIDDTNKAIGEAYFDVEKRSELMREIVPYILDQCWYINLPQPYNFTIWQPWIGGLHGEFSVGYVNVLNFLYYIWVDQDVKEYYMSR